jgi:hypothetical protein
VFRITGDWPPSRRSGALARREGGKVARTRRLESLRYPNGASSRLAAPQLAERRLVLPRQDLFTKEIRRLLHGDKVAVRKHSQSPVLPRTQRAYETRLSADSTAV